MIDLKKLRELASRARYNEKDPFLFEESASIYGNYASRHENVKYIAAMNPQTTLELLDRLGRYEEVIESILNTVSLDWYVQNFAKQENKTNGQSGVAAKIYNQETMHRIKMCFQRAREALRAGKE